MAPNGPGRIFVPTNPDLVDIFGDTDLGFENLYFLDFLDPEVPDSQISRFLDFQTEAWAWARLGPAGAPSAAAPRHLRTTKLLRSKELGQHRENPISASPVWGTISQAVIRAKYQAWKN